MNAGAIFPNPRILSFLATQILKYALSNSTLHLQPRVSAPDRRRTNSTDSPVKDLTPH
jgi:hypothetical protein